MKLVFVYSGNALPKYARKNIETTAIRWPNLEIILLSDKQIKGIKSSNVKNFVLKLDINLENRLNFLRHDLKFRNGFWLHTLKRFLYLEEYAKQINESYIHIESDVLLLDSFPLDKFSVITNDLAYPLISDEKGIASIFYVRDKLSIRRFNNFIFQKLLNNQRITDMSILSEYVKENPGRVYILPTKPNFECKEFSGIFDGASFGIYLTGTDPRNKNGISDIFVDLTDHSVKPSQYHYLFRNGKLLVTQDKLFTKQLYNLHIHSKNLKYFKNMKKLSRNTEKLRNKNPRKMRFYIKVFMQMMCYKVLRKIKLNFNK